MAGIKLNISGIKETLDLLKKEGKNLELEIDAEFASASESIVTEAKQRVPKNYGVLSSSITAYKKDNLYYTIVAEKDYAAYVEFGTGDYASKYVPSLEKEWQDVAMTFYKNGKGILPSKPYLYPAFKRQTPILIKRIEDILNKDVRL